MLLLFHIKMALKTKHTRTKSTQHDSRHPEDKYKTQRQHDVHPSLLIVCLLPCCKYPVVGSELSKDVSFVRNSTIADTDHLSICFYSCKFPAALLTHHRHTYRFRSTTVATRVEVFTKYLQYTAGVTLICVLIRWDSPLVGKIFCQRMWRFFAKLDPLVRATLLRLLVGDCQHPHTLCAHFRARLTS